MDDSLLRRRLEAVRFRGPDPAPGWPRQRFKVIDGGNLPTAVPRVFWAAPVGPVIGSSTPAEGGAVASTALANTEAQPIVVIGPEAPTVGRELLAWRVNDQWVADYGLGDPGGPPGGPNSCCSSCASGASELLWPRTLTVTGPSGGGVIESFPDAFGCYYPSWGGVIRVPCTGVKLVSAVHPLGFTYCRLPDINACCNSQPMATISACVRVSLGCVKVGMDYFWQMVTQFMYCAECPHPFFPIGCGAHGLIPVELCGSTSNIMCGGGGGSAPCGEPVFGGHSGTVFYMSSINQTTSIDRIPATLINCREPRQLAFSVVWPGSAGYATVTVDP